DVADALQIGERASGRACRQLGIGQLFDAGRCVAKRAHAIGGLTGAFEQERDLPQVSDGITHGTTLGWATWLSCTPTRSGRASRRPAGSPRSASDAWTSGSPGFASCPPTSARG